ncbi:MAG: alpha/beta hydrolase [Candidatus Heritagella sp.]
MKEKLYEIRSEFHTFYTDRCGNGGTGLSVYYPKEKTPRSQIAVIAMHPGGYMGFSPMIEMAKRGFIAAGVMQRQRHVDGWLREYKTCIDFVKKIPGVKKVVLMGHSQGGCTTSCYQYIAENGIARFKNTDRIIPFPDVEPLTPADGLILTDANYGIMSVLPLDPAVRTLKDGYARIPELDIFNPENGYAPGGSHYSEEFVRRFQRAQIRLYKELLSYAQDRYEKIRRGRGRFADDEPLVIPGGAGGSSNNKPFCMDVRLLGHTSMPHPLLHSDGSITTDEIIRTVRKPVDSVPSTIYQGGAQVTTVKTLLENEVRFDDDFGYDACTMWGVDGNFNYLSTRENVKGIHVPLLLQGNTASHEFVNTEFNYMAAASEDKEIFMSEGSCHDFAPVDPKYGDTLTATCRYFAGWIGKPGRFME